MRPLGTEARSLVDLAKQTGEPDDEALRRVRRALLAKVAAGGAAGGVALAAASHAQPAGVAALSAGAPATLTAGLVVPAKLAVVLALVVGAGAGTAYVARHASRDEAPSNVASQPTRAQGVDLPRRTSAPTQAAPTDDPVSSTASARDLASAVRTPAPPAATRATPAAAPTVTTPEATRETVTAPRALAAPPGDPATTLTEDAENLRLAQEALEAGDPASALRAAGRVGAESALSEDAEGMQILARCSQNAPGARDDAARFVARRPGSPLSVRIEAACSGARGL